jgi:hypothetical protein
MMDHVVSKLEVVFAYMDNSWVGSPDRQTHLVHLKALFAALAANGLTVNLIKCVFAVPTWKFWATHFWQQFRPHSWTHRRN